MAEGEEIQPLVCDNGTGMVKVTTIFHSSLLNVLVTLNTTLPLFDLTADC